MAKAAAAAAAGGGGAALPKFGEWDVENASASAQGYTAIFSKARDDKKTTKANPAAEADSQLQPAAATVDHHHHHHNNSNGYDSPTFNKNEPYHPPQSSRKLKWLCCG